METINISPTIINQFKHSSTVRRGGMGMGSEARPEGLTRIAISGVPFLWLVTISFSIELVERGFLFIECLLV